MKKSRGERLLFIDNIRILLISLVILTHLAITYGAVGSWYYHEVSGVSVSAALLTLLTSLFQTFLMGFFFMIAAYFIPGSLGRKGTRRFVHDRLVRLGVPLVIWVLIISPIFGYLVARAIEGFPGSFPDWYFTVQPNFHYLGLGPLWFVFSLLVFTLVYVAWNAIRRKPREGSGSQPFPALSAILLFGVLLAAVSFTVRILFPIGYEWELFAVQVPYYPQYIALFIVGLIAAGNDWFVRVPPSTGRTCALLALILALLQPLLLLTVDLPAGDLAPLLGGLHWQACAYALWEQVTGILIIVGLVWGFRKWFNHQGPVTSAAAADTYTVYIIHPLVLVPLSLGLLAVALPPFPKFLLVSVLAIPLCFIIAHLVRSIPGAQRVL
ncbi:MAG: acyltransferase family protein [Methanomicrobiales archaeon]|nr:acyltransferase family protein [Methanomicrobiales archaeon]